MIYVDGANLTVGGDGKLTGTSSGQALYAYKGITINGGTIEVSTYYGSISSYGDVIINDGDITVESKIGIDAIYSSYDVTINGGNVTAISGYKAIGYGSSGSFTVAEGMKIQASTTVDGELGEYVAANLDTYKKIVIKPDASNITVNCIGDIDYTVSGNVVTVDHDVACRVGYMNGESYVAIKATDNGDGTYSYTAPEGVSEVLLVVKGDVNGDGAIDKNDYVALKRYCFDTMVLNSEAIFASNINNDDEVNKNDYVALKRACFGTMVIAP